MCGRLAAMAVACLMTMPVPALSDELLKEAQETFKPIPTGVPGRNAGSSSGHCTVSGQKRSIKTIAQTSPQPIQVVVGWAACHSRIRL